jgi:ABC-2 type transport system permease protein
MITAVVAFVRRELVSVVHQPRLLVTLVLGPFLVLVAFGLGYRNERLVLDAVFVAPADSALAAAIDESADGFSEFIAYQGMTHDEGEARERLDDGDVDVVVVLPSDPVDTVLSGRQAVVAVIHDKLDPIQQTAIDFAARLAVDRLNAEVLARIVGTGQDTITPVGGVIERLASETQRLSAAAASGSPEEVTAAATAVADLGAVAEQVGTVGAQVLGGLDGEQQPVSADDAEQMVVAARRLQDDAAAVAADPASAQDRMAGVAATVEDIEQGAGQLAEIDPAVLVQPFTSSTSTASATDIDITDYFAPAAFALLLQHIGVSLGALTFVRDRELGLMEAYRVSPVTTGRVLVGKYLGFTLVTVLVAVPLYALIRYVLDVPSLGDFTEVVAVLLLLIVASLGIGLLLSLVASSLTHAVQYAMLVLLASLFLGGVFLDLERLRFPVEIVSWLLPVTYAISLLQDVMLRGQAPATSDLAGLASLGAATAALAGVVLHRRLRTQ